jgi:hypothetical protein
MEVLQYGGSMINHYGFGRHRSLIFALYGCSPCGESNLKLINSGQHSCVGLCEGAISELVNPGTSPERWQSVPPFGIGEMKETFRAKREGTYRRRCRRAA